MKQIPGNGILKNKKYFDLTLFFIMVLIIAFGLVMVYSTSSYSASLDFDGDGYYYLKKQIIAIVVGFLFMAFTTFFPYRFYKNLFIPAFLVAAGSVALILTPLGYAANGAKRWLKIGPLSLQPAEICKFCVIIMVAALMSKMSPEARKGWRGFWFTMIPVIILCLMILGITTNLSSAIIIGVIALIMYMVGEKKNKWPLGILLFGLCGAILLVVVLKLGWLPASLSYRSERILAWLDPEAYADGKGMQILQSLYGIGSGGIWGKGLGKSMQKLGFLPEAQNDMIFSIICEELGLIGGFSVIVMFATLLWRIRDITVNCRDYFGNLLVTGVFAHIAVQVVLNIAVVTNTIPNTGVSLPFISYGGSSILFLMGEMGIVFNVGRHSTFVEEEPVEEENETTETD